MWIVCVWVQVSAEAAGFRPLEPEIAVTLLTWSLGTELRSFGRSSKCSCLLSHFCSPSSGFCNHKTVSPGPRRAVSGLISCTVVWVVLYIAVGQKTWVMIGVALVDSGGCPSWPRMISTFDIWRNWLYCNIFNMGKSCAQVGIYCKIIYIWKEL